MTDIEYVYERPKKKHVKEIIAFIIVAAVAVTMIFYYERIFSLFSASTYLTEEQCTEEVLDWCGNCFRAERLEMESSELFENQNVVSRDVIECSNLYFDSNWTEGQSCKSYLTFCYIFSSE